MKVRRRHASFAVTVALAAFALSMTAACDGEDMTVGSGPVKTVKTSFEAGEVWTGYVENYKFKSGSDRISIAFSSATTGTIILGDQGHPLPPMDPNVPYPPGLGSTYDSALEYINNTLNSGIPFELQDAIQEPSRLRFTIDPRRQIWKDWCAAQTSYFWPLDSPVQQGFYSCIPPTPNAAGSPAVNLGAENNVCSVLYADGALETKDCLRFALCVGRDVCHCSATGCERPKNSGLRFDIALDGDKASGSSDLGQIRLVRQ